MPLIMPVTTLIGFAVLAYAIQGGRRHPACGRGSVGPPWAGGVQDPTRLPGPDPLEVLRDSYAVGTIDPEEFERRLETPLRTYPSRDRPLP
ncbi:MAG: SHOCT domain-containing protein [Candidatus Dormibacteria bacterium]